MPSICLQKYHVSYIANRLLEERGNTKTSSVLPLNTISLSNLETKIMGELDSMWKAALNCYDGSVKQGNACHCLLNPELCGNVLPSGQEDTHLSSGSSGGIREEIELLPKYTTLNPQIINKI